MKLYASVLVAFVVSFSAGVGWSKEVGKWDRDGSWLLSRARTIVANAGRQTTNGITIWSPAGLSDFYSHSVYPRDFYYTVAACPECFTNEQIRLVIDWMMKRQAADGRIANSIGTNGKPWFWLFDNSQFMVGLVYLYTKESGDTELFAKHAKNLERAMEWLPRNTQTNLVTSTKPEHMYGFQDSIQFQGDELFTSVLYYQAAVRLSELFDLLEDKAGAQRWRAEAGNVRCGLKHYMTNGDIFTLAVRATIAYRLCGGLPWPYTREPHRPSKPKQLATGLQAIIPGLCRPGRFGIW